MNKSQGWIKSRDITTMKQKQKNMHISWDILYDISTGLIPDSHPDNERCRYKITASLIGWAQIQIQSCKQYGIIPLSQWLLPSFL